MRIKRQARFYLCEKILTRKIFIPRTWTRKEVVFYSWNQTTRNESIFPRNAQKQRWWKISTHFCADEGTIETVFRTIISVNQLSIYGAVSDLCEEYKACHARTGRHVLAGQSDPLSVRWWNHQHLRPMILRKKIYCKSTKNEWKGYHNQIDWWSFVLMQDSWQRLTSDSTSWQNTLTSSYILQSQWLVVSKLCQEMRNHLTRKVGLEGTPKLGPYWKSQPVTHKVNMQWKFELNLSTKTILTRGSEFVMAWTNWSQTWATTRKTTITSRKPLRCSSKILRWNECTCFCDRSKAKTKPQRRTPASSSTRTVPIGERTWTDIEPDDYSPIANPVSKQLSTILRHGDVPREEDGAIDFWRLKDCLRYDFENSRHWSDEMWKSTMAKGGGKTKRFQYCTDPSGQEILYLRALQGHSGRNPIDPSLQDNVLIPNNFFKYIYHIGCVVSVHSITNSGLKKAGGQNSSRERQTVLFTSVDPMNKELGDPVIIDLEAPRLAWYKQKTWKKHQNTV